MASRRAGYPGWLAAAVSWQSGARVTELRTEVEIAASPERVWSVLTDFAAFPTWNPFLANVAGELQADARLRVVVSLHDGSELRLNARVGVCDPPSELRWTAHQWLPSLIRLEHLFLLKPTGDGHTRLVHGEDLDGGLLEYLPRRTTLTLRGMVHMNEALRVRVEAQSPRRLELERGQGRNPSLGAGQ